MKSLRIVLVLSMIGSGLSLLSYASFALFLPTIRQLFESGSMVLPEEMMVAVETLLQPSRFFYVLSAFFYGLSLYGVILMWRLRQTGFHCYTLAQLILLTLPVLFMGKAYFAIGDAMMSLLFIFFYFFTLKSLGVFSPQTQEDDHSLSDTQNENDADDDYIQP